MLLTTYTVDQDLSQKALIPFKDFCVFITGVLNCKLSFLTLDLFNAIAAPQYGRLDRGVIKLDMSHTITRLERRKFLIL